MPRELDPEWLWRARLWAAAWKTPLFIALGFFWGAVFMITQFIWPGAMGLMAGMCWTAVCLLAVYLILGGWRE